MTTENTNLTSGDIGTVAVDVRSQLQFEEEVAMAITTVQYTDGAVSVSEVTLLPSTGPVFAVRTSNIVALSSGEGEVQFMWTPLSGRCGLQVSDTTQVSVSLPDPMAVQTSLLSPPHSHTLTFEFPRGPASLAGVSTMLFLQVELVYQDGRTLNVTSDPRTVYSPSRNLITVSSEGIVAATGQGVGPVQLSISFNHTNLTAMIYFEIVELLELRLQVFPYPPYPGSDTSELDTLFTIGNTGVWQRGSVTLSLVLTNNDTIDVTHLNETVVSVNTLVGPVMPTISSSFVLTVQGPGTIELRSIFGPTPSIPLLLTVSNTPVSVANMSINLLESSTLGGLLGSSGAQLTVDITFTDSTQYLNFPANPSLPSLPSLITFNTSSLAIRVSESGLLLPMANSISPITVQANAGTVTATTSFVVNLDPDIGDVDLGQLTGPPLPSAQVGAIIFIPLFVNTGSRSLGSVSIVVTYDPRVLQVVEAGPGPDWEGVQETVLNDPPGEVRFVGALTVDGVIGPRLHLFNLMVQVTSSASTSHLGGTVVTLAERNLEGTPIGSPTPRPFVAGDIMFSTSAAVGRRSAADATPLPVQPPAARWRRATNECPAPPCACSGRTAGDVDGNCVFDVRDVAYSLNYTLESLVNFTRPQGQEILRRTSEAQLQQLDPNQDGVIDASDVYFLLRATSGKLYLLQNVVVTPVQNTNSSCNFTVQVQLTAGGTTSEALTKVEVFVDISFTTSNLQSGFDSSTEVLGSLVTGRKSPGLVGGVLQAERTGSDVFTVQLNASFVDEEIGISVILATFDASNTTDASRTAQFFGHSPPIYTSPLNLTIPARGSAVIVVATAGYSPLVRTSNTLQSQDCSDDPLIGPELSVTFVSPFQADLEWTLLNIRMGIDFTPLIQLYVTNCSVSQNGSTEVGSCEQFTVRAQTNTSHTLTTVPFTDYQFEVRGPTTQSGNVQIHSPEIVPEGLSSLTTELTATTIIFIWSPPTHPNGIITHYTLHVNTMLIFNGSTLSFTILRSQLQPGTYTLFLEAHNSVGSTRVNVTLELPPPVGVGGPPMVGPLTVNTLLGLVVAGALVVVVVLLVMLAAAMLYQRRRRKKRERGPSILSSDFEAEKIGVEERPLPGDGVDALLPLTVQKGKHFAEKFTTEDSATFWYRDEKGIELLPPYVSSADESSEGEYPPEIGYEDQWELGDLPPSGELDMSDLWVSDDTVPLTETKRRSRKFSLSRQRKPSTKDQHQQHRSSILRHLSLSRRREEDQLRLVEEEEEPVGEPDVLSDKEMESFKSQIAALDKTQVRRDSQTETKRRDSRTQTKRRESQTEMKRIDSRTEMKRKVSVPVRESPLHEEPPVATEQPEPSRETASELANRLRDTVKSGAYRTQYNTLKSVQPPTSADQASLPCNAPKNRYRNALPPDHTRVKLLDADPKVEGSDYINASFLDGHSKRRDYIASQAPLSNTTTDFWKMVWQQRSQAIVMTTNTVEGTKNKSAKYWPDQGSTQTYGPVTIRCVQQKKHNGYMESKLLVSMEGSSEKRHLTHYHYTMWPDFGNPPVSGFLDMVYKVGESVKGKPIVAHCSAGLGRTGVFVTVHTALECHRAKDKVEIEAIVRRLRQQRGGMIQTLDQYRFCFDAVAEALSPEQLPRTESEPTRRPRTKEARPFSEPPSDQDTPRTRRRKLYLQDAIPPPPPYPPPPSDSEDESKVITTPPTSPPPPSTSPPPTSPPPPSTSPPPTSPPPPSTSPPPPLTPEVTPVKVPATHPEIVVTPPTRRPSEESDDSLLQRKLTELVEDVPPPQEDKKTVEEQSSKTSDKQRRDSPPEKALKKKTNPATSGSRKDEKSSIKKKTQPTEPQQRKPSAEDKPKPGPVSSAKKEKPETFAGFEMPMFSQEEEAEEESDGFKIGDDQVLSSKPYKKPEKKPTPRWQPLQQAKSPAAPKPQRKLPAPKVAQPAVNRGTEEDKAPPQKVGKLVIPAAFGGVEGKPKDKTPARPIPSPVTEREVPPQVEREMEPPPSPSDDREQPTTSGRTGSKWQTPSQSTSPAPSSMRRSKPPEKNTQPPTNKSGGQTPPILRMIRQIEKGSPSPTHSPSHSPIHKPQVRPTEETMPVEKPKTLEKPVSPPPSKTEEASPAASGNFATLLARFQGGQ